MQVLSVRALFFYFLGISAIAAQDFPESIQDLSPQELSELETELLTWKLSGAGQTAKKNGFVPISSGMSILGVDAHHDEQLQRLLNAKREIERIQRSQPHATFSIKTPFALMTKEEFAAYTRGGLGQLPTALTRKGASPQTTTNRSLHEESERRVLANLPTSVDWESYGCVTPVRDQGNCNTCVAFSTIAAVESSVCIRSGYLLSFSEQDSISCGIYKGNCLVGQYIQMGFDWMQRLNGGSICTADTFPLVPTVETASQCRRYDYESETCTKPDLNIVGYNGELLVPRNTVAMMQNLAVRPVVAEINSDLLQFYSAGVLMGDEAACPAAQINHAVLLTGYGEQNGVSYWRFKNSWGLEWGEEGYVKIQRSYSGHPMGACGIERSYHYPVFVSDAPYLASRRSSPFKQNVEFSGPILDTVGVVGALDCSEKCRVKAECKAFSYDPYDSVCHRLSAVTAETPRTDHQSGRILTRTQTDTQCLIPEWHSDYPDNDIQTAQAASYTDCCDLCNKVDNCNAYVWTNFHGGSCYLKSKKSRSVWKGANSDGSAYFIPAEVYKCQPLLKNTDLTGQDIDNAPASRAESCCAECRLVDGCTGFTWTNCNGGTCWLKSGTFTQTANTGAMSGLL